MDKLKDMALAVLVCAVAILAMIAYAQKLQIDSYKATEIANNAARAEANKGMERENNKTVQTIERIKTVYVPQIQTVIEYKGDSNDSCKNANSLINSTVF